MRPGKMTYKSSTEDDTPVPQPARADITTSCQRYQELMPDRDHIAVQHACVKLPAGAFLDKVPLCWFTSSSCSLVSVINGRSALRARETTHISDKAKQASR